MGEVSFTVCYFRAIAPHSDGVQAVYVQHAIPEEYEQMRGVWPGYVYALCQEFLHELHAIDPDIDISKVRWEVMRASYVLDEEEQWIPAM